MPIRPDNITILPKGVRRQTMNRKWHHDQPQTSKEAKIKRGSMIEQDDSSPEDHNLVY